MPFTLIISSTTSLNLLFVSFHLDLPFVGQGPPLPKAIESPLKKLSDQGSKKRQRTSLEDLRRSERLTKKKVFLSSVPPPPPKRQKLRGSIDSTLVRFEVVEQ